MAATDNTFLLSHSNSQLAISSRTPSPHPGWAGLHQPRYLSIQISVPLVLYLSAATTPSIFTSSLEEATHLNSVSSLESILARELGTALPACISAGVAAAQTVQETKLHPNEQRAVYSHSRSAIPISNNSFIARSESGFPASTAPLPEIPTSTNVFGDPFPPPEIPTSATDILDNPLNTFSESVLPGNTAPPQRGSMHQPVLETQISSHSELSANLNFLSTLTSRSPDPIIRPHNPHLTPSGQSNQDKTESACVATLGETAWKNRPLRSSTEPFSVWPPVAISAGMAAEMHNAPRAEVVNVACPPLIRRELAPVGKTQPTSRALSNAAPACPVRSPLTPPQVPHNGKPSRTSATSRKLSGGIPKAQSRVRQVKLACLFCRERKIACAALRPDYKDKDCDQCSKRGLPCVFPKPLRKHQNGRQHLEAVSCPI